MELSNYQTSNIGWLLSDIVDKIQINGNGIATVEFAVTPQQLYSVAKFLEQFKDEYLKYESKSIIENCKKINDYLDELEH